MGGIARGQSLEESLTTLRDGSASAERREQAEDHAVGLFESLRERLEEASSPLTRSEAVDLFLLCDEFYALSEVAEMVPYSTRELLDLSFRAATLSQNHEFVAHVTLLRAREDLRAGRTLAARQTLEKSLRSAGRAPAIEPWMRLELATLLRQQAEFASAFRLLDQAERSLDPSNRQARHPSLVSAIHGERGRLYQKLGNLDRAAYWYRQEEDAARDLEDPAVHQSVLLHGVRFALASGNPRLAQERAGTALAEPSRWNFSADSRAQLRWHQLHAELRLAEREELSAVLEIADRCKEQLLEKSLPPLPRMIAWLRLSWVRAMHRDFQGAEFSWQQASQIFEGLKPQLTSMEAGYHLCFLLATRGHLARRRGDLAAILAQHRDELVTALASFQLLWSQAPLLEGGIGLLWYRDQSRVLAELIELTLATRPGNLGIEEAVQHLLLAQSLGTLSRHFQLPPRALPLAEPPFDTADHGLLLLFLASDRGHVFALENNRWLHGPTVGRNQLQQRRNALARCLMTEPARDSRGRVSDQETKRWQTAATQLRKELLPASIRDRMQHWDAITIVGEEWLEWIPFELLASEAREVAVSYSPSVALHQSLGRGNTDSSSNHPRRNALAVFTSPIPGNDPTPGVAPPQLLPDLPSLQRELAQIYEPRNWEYIRGKDATVSRLRQEAPHTRVLQILTHGITIPSEVRPATLLLTPESGNRAGTFTCSEAESLTSPPLVVLTACWSGKGPIRRGDSFASSFPSAFFRSGARAVLVSPASLDTEATLAWQVPFHRALVDGASPAEALREARQQLSADPKFAHPYYYALLRVIGRGHDPVH